MFGNPFKKISKQQDLLKEELERFELQETSPDGWFTCTISGTKKMIDLKIHKEHIEPKDMELFEDSIVVTFNKLSEKIDQIVAEKTQKLLGELLPPGFEDLLK